MMWKLCQIAVLATLTVLHFEMWRAKDPGASLLISAIIALAITVILFAPIMHLQMWLARRRLLKHLRSK
jgi:hypothetical protein